MAHTAAAFKQIYDTLKANALPMLDEWQDITDLMLPSKSNIQTRRVAGSDRMQAILDPTALQSAEALANHIYSLMLSFVERFFSLNIERLEENQAIQTWLEETARAMYEAMTSDDSPIPTSVHEMLLQFVAPGTGCLFVDERPFVELPVRGFRGLTARSQPVGSYYIAENGLAKVDTVYRDLELAPRQAAQIWGIEALSVEMQTLLRSNSTALAYQPSPFIHGVGPDEVKGPFRGAYMDAKAQHMVVDVDLPRFPYMVPRWGKVNSFSPWGYGRGQMAMPDAQVLNTMDADALRAYALNNNPYNFFIGEQQETINRLSYLPGSANALAKGSSVVSGRPGTDFAAMNVGIDRRQLNIRRTFFLDVLDFLPPVEQRTARTFSELALRGQVMARLMGPAFGRFMSEFLNLFLDQVFGVMADAGALPEIPAELLAAIEAENVTVNVRYEGELASTQRQGSLTAMDEGLELSTRMAQEQQDPTLLQVLNQHKTLRRRLLVRGMPKDLLNDERFVQSKVAEQTAQREAAAQAEGLRQDAQAAGQAAPMVTAVDQVQEVA